MRYCMKVLLPMSGLLLGLGANWTATPFSYAAPQHKARPAHKATHASKAMPAGKGGVASKHLQALNAALIEAARAGGETDKVKALLTQGANVNARGKDGETPLMAGLDFTIIVQLLLSKGADVNAKDDFGTTALMKASAADIFPPGTAIVQSLLAKGADLKAKNNAGDTAVMAAVGAGRTDNLKVLLDKSPDMTAQERDTWMNKARVVGFINAAHFGRLEKVEEMQAEGVDINARDKNGDTALILASDQDHGDIMKFLLAKGADVNAKNKNGDTALMRATEEQHGDIMKFLLAKGADVNAKDNDGKTALMIASEWSQTDIMKILLSNGADVNVKNNDGLTAQRMASTEEARNILKRFKKPAPKQRVVKP